MITAIKIAFLPVFIKLLPMLYLLSLFVSTLTAAAMFMMWSNITPALLRRAGDAHETIQVDLRWVGD